MLCGGLTARAVLFLFGCVLIWGEANQRSRAPRRRRSHKARAASLCAVWLCELRVSPGSGASAVEEEKTENTSRSPKHLEKPETREHLKKTENT